MFWADSFFTRLLPIASQEAQQAPYKKLFVEAQEKYKADMAAFLAAGGEAQKGAAAKRKEKRLAKDVLFSWPTLEKPLEPP